MPLMRRLLIDLWHLVWTPGGDPIYRREMAGWSYPGPWRSIQRGCLPLIAVLLGGSVCLCSGSCGVTVLPSAQPPAQWLLLPLALGAGLLVGESLLGAITGLITTALAATTVSAEMEAQTYGLLRLTAVSPRQIVLAKLAAVFHQVRTPVLVMMTLRLLLLLLGLVTAAGLTLVALQDSGGAASSQTPPAALPVAVPPLPGLTGALTALYVALGVLALMLIALWLAYYLLRPALDILLFGSLGIFASSLARTRANGLLTAAGLRILLGAIAYVAGQVLSASFSLISLPVSLLPGFPTWLASSNAAPGLLGIGAVLIAIAILLAVVSAQIGASLFLVGAAIGRAQSLPFG